MFTGIVQTTGVVRSLRRQASGAHIELDAPRLKRPLPHGSSVCVSGVCLTVTDGNEPHIRFDVIPETLERSTLGSLSVGRRVNLERSLGAGDPLDGHIVQGHIDGVGVVRQVETGQAGHVITIGADASLLAFIIPKGSVAVDGVSLTIAAVEGEAFRVAIIPTTLAMTTLDDLRPGSRVNIETDILARTVVTTLRRWHQGAGGEGLTIEKLQADGW